MWIQNECPLYVTNMQNRNDGHKPIIPHGSNFNKDKVVKHYWTNVLLDLAKLNALMLETKHKEYYKHTETSSQYSKS